MARRAAVRPQDIRTTLAVLREHGIAPTALDTLPDGTCRWHFTERAALSEDDLDREIEEFEQRHHGEG